MALPGDNRSAFPFKNDPGMSLREYAAIKLMIGNSGTPWLDEMIRESLICHTACELLSGMIDRSIRPESSSSRM